MSHILTLMTFIPLGGALIILCLPRDKHELIKIVAAITTSIPLVLAVLLYLNFDRSTHEFQFVEHYKWIEGFNIEYFMGVDGLSAIMILLTALLCFICIFASWGIDKGVKGYFSLFLLLDTGMVGVFTALDFFLFYIFWEVMLLPMYFLIGIWGGPRKEYAAIKFFLYTLLGSVLMLLAMLYLYFTNDHTFDMTKLMAAGPAAGMDIRAILVWLAFFVAFAIKVPLFPFHTWLPDAHVEAPTAISVILAGILLKMGTYAMLRINFPMLPEVTERFSYFMAVLGLINIIYGALVAMAQKDLKKLVAYSSISHMGFVLLGMSVFTREGINGAVFQMFNHGTITAMLFLMVGVIYDRAHHREIDGFGGLAQQMPAYTGISCFAFFAALGLPGLSSFISEVLVLLGAFNVYRLITILAVSGVVITAAYCLWTVQRMFLGPLNPRYAHLPEINGREMFTMMPLAVIVVILGVYPMPVLNMLNVSLDHLIEGLSPMPLIVSLTTLFSG